MGGTYRRSVLLRARSDTVLAAMEDDPHHFRVWLRHEGNRVVDLEGEAVRSPWTTCPSSTAPLRALIGMELSPRSTAPGAVARARANCTHLFDLAGLAIAFATTGLDTRRYDCEVPEPVLGPTLARLRRDDAPFLEWNLERMHVSGPAPFQDVNLMRGFGRWCEQNLQPEQIEAALILRRAAMIAGSRTMNLDAMERPGGTGTPMGSCFTYTPGTVEHARRNHGTVRDFSDRAHEMLADEPEFAT